MDSGNEQRFDRCASVELFTEMQRLWHLPLALSTCWWNAMVDALWPHIPNPHHVPHHEEHEQLVVPEPIEEAGEHALFA